MKWIKTSDRLPEDSRTVLIIFSGNGRRNVTYIRAISTASFFGTDGWEIDCLPRHENSDHMQVEWWAEIDLAELYKDRLKKGNETFGQAKWKNLQ